MKFTFLTSHIHVCTCAFDHKAKQLFWSPFSGFNSLNLSITKEINARTINLWNARPPQCGVCEWIIWPWRVQKYWSRECSSSSQTHKINANDLKFTLKGFFVLEKCLQIPRNTFSMFFAMVGCVGATEEIFTHPIKWNKSLTKIKKFFCSLFCRKWNIFQRICWCRWWWETLNRWTVKISVKFTLMNNRWMLIGSFAVRK